MTGGLSFEHINYCHCKWVCWCFLLDTKTYNGQDKTSASLVCFVSFQSQLALPCALKQARCLALPLCFVGVVCCFCLCLLFSLCYVLVYLWVSICQRAFCPLYSGIHWLIIAHRTSGSLLSFFFWFPLFFFSFYCTKYIASTQLITHTQWNRVHKTKHRNAHTQWINYMLHHWAALALMCCTAQPAHIKPIHTSGFIWN